MVAAAKTVACVAGMAASLPPPCAAPGVCTHLLVARLAQVVEDSPVQLVALAFGEHGGGRHGAQRLRFS